MGKCAKNMKRGYAMGGMVDQEPDQAKLLAGLLSTFQKPEQKSLTQAQIINSDMNNLGKVDSTPGEGEGAAHNWMVQSATDIAQSQGRNPNAAYSPGSRNDPHSAMMPTQPQGIAQPLQQPAYQAPSYRQKQQPRNLLSGIAGYADGGKVESVEELLARMQSKYKTGSQAPAPAPSPTPAPVVQTVQPQPQGGIGGAYNALKNRQQQIDKAAGYANGGKIKGPGTPTSDSIPANVEETGEPIQVSNGERILSRDQDAMLQGIAKKMGFDSLDALLEAGTGKPVGPTMKGGKMHAATGATEDEITKAAALRLFNASHGNTADITNKRMKVPFGGGATQEPIRPIAEAANQPYDNAAMGQPDDTVTSGNGAAWKGIADAFMYNSDVAASRNKLQQSSPLAAEVPSNNQGSARSMAMGADTDAAMHNATRQTSLPNGIGSFVQNGQTYDVQNAGQEGIKRVTAKGQNPLFTNLDPSQATAQMAGMKSGTIQTGGGQKDAGWINDAYGNDMRPTIAMQKQLEQMQRDRYGRDLGSDIKDPRVMAAAAMGLSNMNQDRRASMVEQQQERQGISAGLDDQMKRNSLAAAAQQQSLIDKINDPQTSEEQRHVLRSNLLAMQGKNPNDHRYMQQPNRKIYNDMGQVIAEEPGGIFDTVNERNVGQQKTQQQASSIHNDPRAAKIAQDKNLSMDEKRKQIAALGYSN